ncbi:hypothetical protein Enr8_35580 [Blastopirellula retiformator]|uniref:Uncharacterized protein n=1 Tax=Blastopirellula retiformator TaxID=2527970 RepID=A0A5C5UZ53_9BACT|nr:hypothetical protein Enr8_35580 [Blastopirellula retiformator]
MFDDEGASLSQGKGQAVEVGGQALGVFCVGWLLAPACGGAVEEELGGYSDSVPLVLGTPGMRGSCSTAIRSARAADLKIASATWWLLRL